MKKVIALLFIVLSQSLLAQNPGPQHYLLSLEEAVELGLNNNYSARNSQKDVEKAIKQKWEIISQGLPQISGAVDYQNYIKQPVTLIPAELSGGEPGTYTPVTFGTQQSMNAAATWNQLIFDGSYIVGIQSAKTLLQISRNAKTKTNLEVKKAVINAYGNVLLAQESILILQKNLDNVQKTFDQTKEIYNNGMAEEEDVEQLELTLLGLQNNLNRSQRMLDISFEMFNFSLGVPIETEITLTDDLEGLAMEHFDLSFLKKEISVEENIDYRIAKNSTESAEIYVKLEKAKALPTLTGFLNYGLSGFNEEFTFFSNDHEYFDQSILGISLNIPIFSSGMRGARTQQRKIEHEQAVLELEETSNKVKLQINSARNDYEFSLENYATQRRNLDLAGRIEKKNQIKFFEGLASSFELNEAQRQLYAAQQDYLQAMLDVINTKVSLENLLDTTRYEDEN